MGGRPAGALGGQSAAATVDAASSRESRAPKRPLANASAQSSVWHTPAARKRRLSIASLLGRAYVATDSLFAVIVSLLASLVEEWVCEVADGYQRRWEKKIHGNRRNPSVGRGTAPAPVKRTGDDAEKFAEPITTTAPKRDNLGTASLTAIEEESHKPQTQTTSTDEVWISHSKRKRDKMPHSPTPGTYSKQQLQTSTDNLGNRKRKGGSNDELQHPSTLRLDTKIPWPVKRSRGFTGEHVKPPTTSSRNAAPLTTHETEKSALTDVSVERPVKHACAEAPCAPRN